MHQTISVSSDEHFQKLDYLYIPVISLSAQGLEVNSGFKYDLKMLKKAMMAIVYGDVFMNVVYRTRPYEKVPGSVNALHEKWKKVCN